MFNEELIKNFEDTFRINIEDVLRKGGYNFREGNCGKF